MEKQVFCVYRKKPIMFPSKLVFSLCIISCNQTAQQTPSASHTVHAMPETVEEIPLPKGYIRIAYTPESQATFLRTLKLKKDKTVYLYNREKKINQSAQYAVLDIDVGTKDLQQCADAAMRLRAEYLWKHRKYDSISFNFTNDFNCDYHHYAKGYRPKTTSKNVSWQKTATADNSYKTFREYLNLVYSYAGTRSLHKQMQNLSLDKIFPGSVFIQTGEPYGHAVTVVDVAYNPATKDTIFLLSQSYMPAQDIHILINPEDEKMSPWYSTNFNAKLRTPEWTFDKTDLKKF